MTPTAASRFAFSIGKAVTVGYCVSGTALAAVGVQNRRLAPGRSLIATPRFRLDNALGPTNESVLRFAEEVGNRFRLTTDRVVRGNQAEGTAKVVDRVSARYGWMGFSYN